MVCEVLAQHTLLETVDESQVACEVVNPDDYGYHACHGSENGFLNEIACSVIIKSFDDVS